MPTLLQSQRLRPQRASRRLAKGISCRPDVALMHIAQWPYQIARLLIAGKTATCVCR
jgi:hypothetical protein